MRWESSRMVLPEHREAILEYRKDLNKKQKPDMDEQELQEIDRKLRDSMQWKQPVSIIIFGEFEDRELSGEITYVDPYLKRVKVEFEDGYEWVDLVDVVNVYAN